jgi:hypothetical protein
MNLQYIRNYIIDKTEYENNLSRQFIFLNEIMFYDITNDIISHTKRINTTFIRSILYNKSKSSVLRSQIDVKNKIKINFNYENKENVMEYERLKITKTKNNIKIANGNKFYILKYSEYYLESLLVRDYSTGNDVEYSFKNIDYDKICYVIRNGKLSKIYNRKEYEKRCTIIPIENKLIHGKVINYFPENDSSYLDSEYKYGIDHNHPDNHCIMNEYYDLIENLYR